MSGPVDWGLYMDADDFNRLRGACIAASWRMSARQLLMLADDLFDEAQSRLRPDELSWPHHLDVSV